MTDISPALDFASLPVAIAVLTTLMLLGVNVLKVGSTRSGKSVSAIDDVVNDANARNCAIVVLDPHGASLARPVLGQLLARGHGHRIRFDRFANYDYVLGLRILKPSKAKTEIERYAENEDTLRLFTSILCRQQDIGSLTSSPLKEEWVLKAGRLYLYQKRPPGEDKLVYAFEPEHPEFTKLVRGCTNKEAVMPFLQIANGTIKPSAYQPAQRLIATVCASPAFKVRCGGDTSFDLERFLAGMGILLIEGESKGNVSPEAMRAMFAAYLIQIIRYVRTRSNPFPRVKVYLDEATNARLITEHEKTACAEGQKYGLDLTIMVQTLDFPSADITKGVLSNCLRHEWFWNGNADQIKKAAEDLGGNRDNDYISQLRRLDIGERFVKERERIYRDRAILLPDPYGLPGLTEKKIDQAIEKMHQSSDYRNLTEPEQCDSHTTENGTTPSSNDQESTPSRPNKSETSSPADRLDIEGLGDCEPDDENDSDQSEPLA